RLVAAQDTPGLAPRLRKEGGWGVIDHAGTEHYQLDGLRLLVSLSPVFYPFSRLLDWGPGRWLGGAFAKRMGGPAAPARPVPSEQGPARPRWEPPGGLVAHAVMVFCLVYVILWNLRTFNFQAYRAIFPDQAAQLGQVIGLEQGWGLFAPMPGRIWGWEV